MCKRNNRAHGQKVGGCLSLLGLPQQTGWLNQEKSICQSSGGWESKVKYQHNQTLGVFFSFLADGCPLAVFSLGGKRERALYFSLEHYFHHEGITLMTSSKPNISPSQPHLQISSHQGLGLQYMTLGGTHFGLQHSASP